MLSRHGQSTYHTELKYAIKTMKMLQKCYIYTTTVDEYQREIWRAIYSFILFLAQQGKQYL